MGKTISIQDGGIILSARWKLFPLDDRNWELCHLHANPDNARTRAAGTVGMVKWQRCGKYYQAGTVGAALRYVADCEMKEGRRESAESLSDALDRYERIVQGMLDALSEHRASLS